MGNSYISASVYKFPLGECTNGGVTAKATTVLVPHPYGYYELEDGVKTHNDMPVMELVTKHGRLHARPVDDDRWLMFGGNFIYSSDSRFQEISRQPIHVHDRHEGGL